MSQKEVGNAVGVSDSTVTLWENDVHMPRPRTMNCLAEFLGQSVGELTGETALSLESSIALKIDLPEFSSQVEGLIASAQGVLASLRTLQVSEASRAAKKKPAKPSKSEKKKPTKRKAGKKKQE